MLTTKEVAKELCVETQTVRNYINNGINKGKCKLIAFQVLKGAKLEWRIKLSDFDQFKKERDKIYFGL